MSEIKIVEKKTYFLVTRKIKSQGREKEESNNSTFYNTTKH